MGIRTKKDIPAGFLHENEQDLYTRNKQGILLQGTNRQTTGNLPDSISTEKIRTTL